VSSTSLTASSGRVAAAAAASATMDAAAPAPAAGQPPRQPADGQQLRCSCIRAGRLIKLRIVSNLWRAILATCCQRFKPWQSTHMAAEPAHRLPVNSWPLQALCAMVDQRWDGFGRCHLKGGGQDMLGSNEGLPVIHLPCCCCCCCCCCSWPAGTAPCASPPPVSSW
jgi:hypothetical protein